MTPIFCGRITLPVHNPCYTLIKSERNRKPNVPETTNPDAAYKTGDSV